jgi:hypothetical protein
MALKARGKPIGPPAREGGEVAPKRGRSSISWLPVLQFLQKRFRVGFVWELHIRTGRHPDVCKSWKSGKHAPDVEAFIALINSDVGDEILRILTRNNQCAWAEAFRLYHEVAKARGLLADAERRLAALKQGREP